MVRLERSPGDRRRRRSACRFDAPEVLESARCWPMASARLPAPRSTRSRASPSPMPLFATYTVTDPSTGPGDQWRGLINFGDGQVDGPLIPIEQGEGFAFIDTHTYKSPGTYTVTVMIAMPGSHQPNDNTVTTTVTVTAGSTTPTSPAPPTTPAPPPSPVATGIRLRAGRIDLSSGRSRA